jgi:glucose-6-phosphate isomerase
MTQSATLNSAATPHSTAISPFPNRQTGFGRLRQLAGRLDGRLITPLFAADPDRARRFTALFDDLSLDFSKSAIDDTARDTLFALAEFALAEFALAETADLTGFRQRLFAGEPVNQTEHRRRCTWRCGRRQMPG